MPKKILIVDDDPIVCELLAGLAGEMGLETEIAHEGAEGLMLALEGTHSLVLLDLHMPDAGGDDAIADIDEGLHFIEILAESRPERRIFVISGYVDETADELARAPNVIGWMAKPFDFDGLKRMIAATVGD